MLRTALALALPFALGACAIVPDTPRVGREAAAQGTAVALNQPVWLGEVIVTPLQVLEDSRCPVDAQCVWAGKLTVSTRITATHWQQTAPMTLGEPYSVMNRELVLVSATPAPTSQNQVAQGDYRFLFGKP